MTRAQGLMLRRVGLFLEAISLFSLLMVAQGKVEVWKRTGLDPSLVLTAGVAIGFVLWLTGTTVMYWPKRKEAPTEEASASDDSA